MCTQVRWVKKRILPAMIRSGDSIAFSESWLTVPETISQSAGEKVSLCFHEADGNVCLRDTGCTSDTWGHSQSLERDPHSIFGVSTLFFLHSNFPIAPVTPVLLPTRNGVIQPSSGPSCLPSPFSSWPTWVLPASSPITDPFWMPCLSHTVPLINQTLTGIISLVYAQVMPSFWSPVTTCIFMSSS